MKTDEQRPPSDEDLNQLRRELLERIVRNEAQRRTEQNATLRGLSIAWEAPPGVAGHRG
ncbi:MAG: hypothetical protein ACYC6Y_21425 [Thermoguttaceae bacterium]